VLHRAKHQPATRALHPDQAPTAEQHHRLAVHLANLYTHTISPDAAISHARDVLDNAYRQAFRDSGFEATVTGVRGPLSGLHWEGK
jgi:hypothetical protein